MWQILSVVVQTNARLRSVTNCSFFSSVNHLWDRSPVTCVFTSILLASAVQWKEKHLYLGCIVIYDKSFLADSELQQIMPWGKSTDLPLLLHSTADIQFHTTKLVTLNLWHTVACFKYRYRELRLYIILLWKYTIIIFILIFCRICYRYVFQTRQNRIKDVAVRGSTYYQGFGIHGKHLYERICPLISLFYISNSE